MLPAYGRACGLDIHNFAKRDFYTRLIFSTVQQDSYCSFDYLQSLMKGPREHGVISSIVSWIATGNNLPSLIETQSCAEFSWFALQVLLCETEYEEETGLGAAVQRELFANPAITVEQALKVR